MKKTEEKAGSAHPAPTETQTEPKSHGHPSTSELQKRIHELEEDRDRLRRANQDLHDKHLRARADYENLVRRSAKESQDSVRYAKSALLLRFIGLVETFEALATDLEAKLGPDAKGIKLVLEDARRLLRDEGVKELPGKGQPFNYKVHQAVERVETNDHAEGTIVEVVQRGYQWGEDVLRPSLVKVAVPARKATPDAPASRA